MVFCSLSWQETEMAVSWSFKLSMRHCIFFEVCRIMTFD
jgi:hypothetical protein